MPIILNSMNQKNFKLDVTPLRKHITEEENVLLDNMLEEYEKDQDKESLIKQLKMLQIKIATRGVTKEIFDAIELIKMYPHHVDMFLDDNITNYIKHNYVAILFIQNLIDCKQTHVNTEKKKKYTEKEKEEILEKISEKGIEIPSKFICTFKQDLMFPDEVVMYNGRAYSKAYLINWLKNQDKDPYTGQKFYNKSIQPNFQLEREIEDWLNQIKF